MNTKVTSTVFLILLFGIAVFNLTSPSRSFSENENRYLRQLPEFSMDRLVSGRFTAELDEYVTDQFVYRDGWIAAKSVSELLLQKHASNEVYFAKGDSLIEMFNFIDLERYEKNLDFTASFIQRVKSETGASARVILVPSASMIQRDKLPAFAPEVNQRELLDMAGEALPGFVDISGDLQKHSDEYIYYRTDHHWTSLGAYYGYNSFLTQTGRQWTPIEAFRPEVFSEDFYGTTWSKASLYTVKPDTITAYLTRELGPVRVDYNEGEKITDSIYERSFLEQKDKYSVFLNANQSVTRISTGVENRRKLLLIKDSYANIFTQFLLRDYEEIIMIDPRYYRSSFVEFAAENGITDILILYSLKGFASDTNIYFLST